MTRRSLALLTALTLMLFTPATLVPQDRAQWEWMSENFGRVLNDLMPLNRMAGRYVVYRSHRDYRTEVPEYYFLIGYDRKENGPGLNPYLSAHVRDAGAISIYDQMQQMYESGGKQDLASVEKKIKIKSWDLTETGCPAIKRQFERFQRIQFTAPKFDWVIVLHPMNHHFRIQSDWGDLDAVLWDDKHPLVLWALETRKALEGCTSAQGRAGDH